MPFTRRADKARASSQQVHVQSTQVPLSGGLSALSLFSPKLNVSHWRDRGGAGQPENPVVAKALAWEDRNVLSTNQASACKIEYETR